MGRLELIFSQYFHLDKKWKFHNLMLTNCLVCIFYADLYIIKYLYILNSISDINFKFGLTVFHEQLIDFHHFGLITGPTYVLQTRIQVFYRLVSKLKTRLVVHLKFWESLFLFTDAPLVKVSSPYSVCKSWDMSVKYNLQTGG